MAKTDTLQAKTFKVFCYGSNMSSKRILERCSTAIFKEVVQVEGYKLSFNKKSKDGSGKGNMIHTKKNEDKVWGVVFEIEESQRKKLEDAEGKGSGYEEQNLNVVNSAGIKIDCIAYITTDVKFIDNNLILYDWYKDHCLIGAKEFNLPEEYVSMIGKQNSKVDADAERVEKEKSIYSIK